MHILLATDADWIVDDVVAALGGDDVHFTVCRDGRAVAGEVEKQLPDLAILDLQIGSMGGMAVTMALRLDESAGAVEHVRVLMLLDRAADIHLARRSGAEGWLIKPLDSLRLRRAADALAVGARYDEGLPTDAPDVEPMVPLPENPDDTVGSSAPEPAEEEPATAG
ncbi:MAG TPA: response regulator [Ilumatobacteraceae bacterium]|nr:response regulator [Ilumatobacteraceae bacterium]